MSDTEIVELDKNVNYVKIHGLQRSGTNYLSYLVNENFENTKALVNLGGWKHGHYMAPWVIGQEVHVLTIVKNPYAWLASVYDYWGPSRTKNIGPDLRGVPFDDFVSNKVHFEKLKSLPYLLRASNPVQYWNNLNFHWTTIRLNQKRLFVVRYETLISNPEKCIGLIGEAFGLVRRPFKDSDANFEPAGEELKEGDNKWNKKEHYLNNGFMNVFSERSLKFVNEELDLDLMVGFKYDYVKGNT